MDSKIDLKTLVLLSLGSLAGYIALKHPTAGAAILVGVGVIALLGSWLK